MAHRRKSRLSQPTLGEMDVNSMTVLPLLSDRGITDLKRGCGMLSRKSKSGTLVNTVTSTTVN